MVTIQKFRKLALSLPEAIELPHFDKASFRVGKKIFATLDEKKKRGCLMFTPVDQSVFAAIDKTILYPVPNKWGLKGATFVELDNVSDEILLDALTTAYKGIAPKRLLQLLPGDEEI